MYEGLDHLAIVVADTEKALTLWRDTMGFPLLFQEKVNGETVLLTHLDLGNVHLQLVEPLVRPHPLWDFLEKNGGSGLHHFCLKVKDVAAAQAESPVPTAIAMHQGTLGKRALFLDRTATDGVGVELTGP